MILEVRAELPTVAQRRRISPLGKGGQGGARRWTLRAPRRRRFDRLPPGIAGCQIAARAGHHFPGPFKMETVILRVRACAAENGSFSAG